MAQVETLRLGVSCETLAQFGFCKGALTAPSQASPAHPHGLPSSLRSSKAERGCRPLSPASLFRKWSQSGMFHRFASSEVPAALEERELPPRRLHISVPHSSFLGTSAVA